MSDLTGYALAALIFFVFVSVLRRRENLAHNLRFALLAIGAGMLVFGIASYYQSREMSLLIAGIVAVVVFAASPKRSRHIPASVRRKKVAEYELRTGKKFDPKRLELDHEIPFSDGGSHTLDNLVVKERQKNRSKGAKAPWWDIFGRRRR